MAELQPKGRMEEALSRSFTGEYNYRIVGRPCPDNFLSDSLIDQFVQENMQFVLLGDSIFEQGFETARITEWNKKGSVVKNRLPQSTADTDWPPCQFKLVDSLHQVLNTYNLENSTQRRKMVEHIALLVTRK
jgi:hypothetical protein